MDVIKNRASALNLTVSDIVGRVVGSTNYFIRKKKRSTTERLLNGQTKDPHLSVLKAHITALGGRLMVHWDEEKDGIPL